MNSASPGVIALFQPNDYYPGHEAYLDALAEDGRLVVIAGLGGAMSEINVAKLMRRRLTLTGSTLRPRANVFKGLLADEIFREVWPLVETGELRPVMDRTFPMADAAKAHARLEAVEEDASRATMLAHRAEIPDDAFLEQLTLAWRTGGTGVRDLAMKASRARSLRSSPCWSMATITTNRSPTPCAASSMVISSWSAPSPSAGATRRSTC